MTGCTSVIRNQSLKKTVSISEQIHEIKLKLPFSHKMPGLVVFGCDEYVRTKQVLLCTPVLGFSVDTYTGFS